MEVKAKLRFIKMAPKKVRRVIDVVRGLEVNAALTQLRLMPKQAAEPVIKLLNSAISNAVNNFNLDKNNLTLKVITANDGPTLKRWMPRAHGRATPIRKRMTHLEIILDEIVPSKKAAAKKVKKAEVVDVKEKKNTVPPEKINIRDERISEEATDEKGHEIHDVRLEGKHRHNQHGDKRTMKGKKGFINKIFNRKVS